jgi:tetratricopeptide (TPR) repeat protein
MRAVFRQLPLIRAVVDRMADDGRPLLRRFLHAPPIEQAFASADPDVLSAGRHEVVLRRFGADQVLGYYNAQVWPSLLEQPATPSVTRGMADLALNAMDTAARFGHSDVVGDWARRAADRAALKPAGQVDFPSRRRLAEEVAARVRNVAHYYADRQPALAIQLFDVIARLGRLNEADRARCATLLWQTGEKGPQSLAVFVGRLAETPTDPVSPELREFARRSIAIDESTPSALLRERIVMNCSLLIKSSAPQPDALRSVGIGYLKLNHPERALEYLTEAQRLSDRGGVNSFYVAQAHYGLQHFAEASDAFGRAAAQGYSKARISAWRSLALAKSGQYDAAIGEFEAAESQFGAADLTSEFFVYWGRASFLYGTADDAQAQAQEKFARALSLDPKDWRAVIGLAACFERTGRRADALDALRTCVDGFRNTGSPGAPAYLLGRLLQADGALEEAAMYYRVALRSRDEDPQYRLALALALDDLGDAGAAAALEQAVATPGADHPELHRRLAISYLNHSDRDRARAHLEHLCRSDRASVAAHALVERDRVTLAVEAFNRGRFADAASLLVTIQRWQDELREPRALALVYDAWNALRQQSLDPEARARVRVQVTEAFGQSQAADVWFLRGFINLVDGDIPSARTTFEGLAARHPERADCDAMLELAALLSGEDGSKARPTEGAPPEVQAVILIFQAQNAAHRGDFAAAAAKFEAWATQVDLVRLLAIPRDRINAFAAFCLRRGATRPAHVLRTLARLSEAYGDDFWELAPVLVKHHEIVARGVAQATVQRIEECESAYRAVMQRAASNHGSLALDAVVAHYVRWVQFRLLVHIEGRDMVSALVALAELEQLPGGLSATVKQLKQTLETHLGANSHEAAYALLRSDAERAQRVWEHILRDHPEDLDALHHLACLHWSRAFDALEADRFDASLPDWRAGLDYYCRLYAIDGYWDGLRDKGRAIVQPGKPFDLDKFETWREDAPSTLAETLLDLIVQVAQQAERGVKQAAALMTILHESQLSADAKQQLSDDLATRRLDPDPLNLPDFEASRRRALQVIEIDEHNVKARAFLLRALVHHVHELHAQGNRDFPMLRRQLESIERQADWLARLVSSAGSHRADLVQALVSYYDEVSDMSNAEAQDGITGVNKATEKLDHALKIHDRHSLQVAARERERRLQHVQSCFRASDKAARRALEIEPADFKALAHLEQHKQVYPQIDDLLKQTQNV